MSWVLPILAVALGAAFYALWARREGLLALESYRRGQLSELSATLGNLQEAVLVVDAENRVRLANHALRRIFADAESLVGARLDAERHGQALLDYLDVVRLRQRTPRRRIEFEAKPRFTGEPERGAGPLVGGASPNNRGEPVAQSVWAEVAGTLMPPLGNDAIGQGAWVLVVLHDITQQHKLETMRKDFVANVSHELRTPLSVIMGYVETLVDAHRTIPEETREQFLLKIQRHTQRLNSLLDDLLSLSRLESEAPNAGGAGSVRERVDLAKLISGVVEDYRGRPAVLEGRFRLCSELIDCGPPAATEGTAPSASVLAESGADAGLYVLGDALQLTRALENLIDNALKYTPSGSEICVSARRVAAAVGADEAEPMDARRLASREVVEVRVRDDGPGIPAEDLPHIFERFYRVDKGRSRAQGGTGLGLSIVKHIVQLHGGRVWARARDEVAGQGTAIYFTLPMA
ncbi:hypothetical protein AXK12_02750 [Cephaloticoccus capnophilus]|uniref:histidine kinase n=1 Tax=Cephaloticoccus capnophilus TaxID=1548208 RepID=A0A139SQA3_9BACT|nr:hypothetical protein AXK12_02750 [Cephaloticoccus capnophilus]